MILRAGFAICLAYLVFFLPSAAAQDQYLDDTIERANEILADQVPKSRDLMLLQLSDVETSLEELDNAFIEESWDDVRAELVALQPQLVAGLEQLGIVDCSDPAAFTLAIAAYAGLYDDLLNLPLPADTSVIEIVVPLQGTLSEQCLAARQKAVGLKNAGSVATLFVELADQIEQGRVADEKYVSVVEELRKKLNERRNSLRATMETDSRGSISENLPLIMTIVAGFSLATIFGVKLFSESIQFEWVASGQVIQFITVMILLSAIMALGLSEILEQETLGTLLGGIGGYVLAQGVGRAAARAVAGQTPATQTNPMG